MATYSAKIAETEYRANRAGNPRPGAEIFATPSVRTQNVFSGSAMAALYSGPLVSQHVFLARFSSDDFLFSLSKHTFSARLCSDDALIEFDPPPQVVPGILDPFLFAVLSYHPYVQAAVTGFKPGRDGSPRATRIPATWDFFASLKER